jgi:hypothetical protein
MSRRERRQVFQRRRGFHIKRGRQGIVEIAEQTLDRRADGRGLALEVEPAHVIAIEEAAADRWWTLEYRQLPALIESAQVVAERAGRLLAGKHCGPVVHESLEHHRLVGRKDFFLKSLEIDPGADDYLRAFKHEGWGCYSERS